MLRGSYGIRALFLREISSKTKIANEKHRNVSETRIKCSGDATQEEKKKHNNVERTHVQTVKLDHPYYNGLVKVSRDITGPVSKPPSLEHDLTKCLYQPMNIFPLRDTRSNVFNFTPFLEHLIKVEHFNFAGIAPFVPPSKDEKLHEITDKLNKKFFSSTSSMTGILSQLHFLISNFRPLNLVNLTHSISPKYSSFTVGARSASAVLMKRTSPNEGNFAITADKSINKDIILSRLGHCLETLLTTTKPEFNRVYNKKGKNLKNLVTNVNEHYHYATAGDFVLRSQLDAYDSKLPGTGVFDLKTRAVAAIRHDIAHIEKQDNFTGYEITKRFGAFESFEREYYELVRSVMLKYSLQATIGDMDGIFVAYHNISKMFGFQYIPLDEMNHILHSDADAATRNKLKIRDELMQLIYGETKFVKDHIYETNQFEIAQKIATAEFNYSMRFLSKFLKGIEEEIGPGKHARIVFKTKTKDTSVTPHEKAPTLCVLVTPIDDAELGNFTNNKLQNLLSKSDAGAVNTYTGQLEFYHSKLVSRTKCYIVKVKHHFTNDFDDQKMGYPYYVSSNRNVKAFFEKILKNDSSTWKHPYFHYAHEVDNWDVEFSVEELKNKQQVKKLYYECLDEQLTLLRTQSTDLGDKIDRSVNIMNQKLERLMNGKSIERRKNTHGDGDSDISTLQALLRAISKKNSPRTKSDLKGERVMWNQ